MKKLLSILLFVCIAVTKAYCQTDTAFIGRTIKNLKNYSANNITEKAYLQFDKPYYAAGDTIYFKAYVTAGDEHHLSALSGVLHVDLINPESKISHFILLQLVNGVAWGDFALADSLPAGNYRVRAYTRLMEKEGYFDKQFAIGSVKNSRVSESVNQTKNIAQADVQFFPEGGNLVTDIRSKIAYKATGTDGLGTEIKGTVTDNYNTLVAAFKTSHAGMGNFTLLPEEGRIYQIKYKLKDSSEHIVNLPSVQKKGITLTVSTANPANIDVVVQANRAYYLDNKNKEYVISIYAGGKFTYVRSKLDSYELDWKLPVSNLRSGVARVTLFDQLGMPLCERLVFVKNPSLDIAPVITTDKITYDQRGEVKVDILNQNVNSDKTGYFSASVINESKAPDASYSNGIYSWLLLTSELKGYIEQPDYYFDNNTDKARNDLNNLMLTQGYRKFTWKEVANVAETLEKKPAERSLILTGTVKTLDGKKPVNNGTVNILSPGGPILTTQTDTAGRFKFSGLIMNDTTRLMLTALTPKGKNNVIIKIDRPVEEEPVSAIATPDNALPDMQNYLQNTQLRHSADVSYDPLKGKLLKEVKVKSYRSSNYGGSGHADQVLDLSKDETGGNLTDVLNGRLNGVSFYGGKAYLNIPNTGPMLIIVDGVQINSDADTSSKLTPMLLTINPRDVETVEVLKYSSATIYGVGSGNGVLVVTTKQGSDHVYNGAPATGVLQFRPNGFYLAKEFYAPKYLPNTAVSAKPDLRSTIYWKPDVKTDVNGKASFSYYNADGAGNYRITLEGIDSSGNIAHTVYRYAVK